MDWGLLNFGWRQSGMSNTYLSLERGCALANENGLNQNYFVCFRSDFLVSDNDAMLGKCA